MTEQVNIQFIEIEKLTNIKEKRQDKTVQYRLTPLSNGDMEVKAWDGYSFCAALEYVIRRGYMVAGVSSKTLINASTGTFRTSAIKPEVFEKVGEDLKEKELKTFQAKEAPDFDSLRIWAQKRTRNRAEKKLLDKGLDKLSNKEKESIDLDDLPCTFAHTYGIDLNQGRKVEDMVDQFQRFYEIKLKG